MRARVCDGMTWNTKNQVLCLFLLSLVVRGFFIFTLEDRLYWPDERAINAIALGLFNGEGYHSEPFRANPVLPFFLAAVYKLFGYNFLVPRVIQSFIGSLTVIILFATAQQVFTRQVSFLSGLGAAVYPPFIYVCGTFYVSCLFTFLIALTVYALLLSSTHKGLRSLTLLFCSGVLLGITVLCRPIFLAFMPFAALFVLVSYRGSPVRRIAYAACLVMLALLTILPWTLRNYTLYEQVLLVSSGRGVFLWRGNNELARGDTDDRYLRPGSGAIWTDRLMQIEPSQRRELTQKYSNVRSDLRTLNALDADRYLQKLAFTFIVQHPCQSWKLFFQKLRTFYTPFTKVLSQHKDVINKKFRLVYSLIFYVVLLLGLFGISYSIKEWKKHLVFYLPIVSLTLAYGMLTAATRYRIPLDSYILIFASYGILVIWDFICTNRKIVSTLRTTLAYVRSRYIATLLFGNFNNDQG